jgi:hypothetical protein
MAHEAAATVTTPSAAALFEAHLQAELHADLEATMATMVDDPHLLNLASGTGGEGAAGVREFYATKLIGQFFPPDSDRPPDGRRGSDRPAGCSPSPARAEPRRSTTQK